MNTHLLLITFGLAPCVVIAGGVTNILAGTLEAQTDILTQSKTNIILKVTVKNVGSEDVLIPYSYLPWDRYAMTLAVVETDPSSTPLAQELTVADPIPGEPWKLNRGESMTGNIDLTFRFPALAKVLERTQVIVFWSYQLPSSTGTKSERIGGWNMVSALEIPSSK